MTEGHPIGRSLEADHRPFGTVTGSSRISQRRRCVCFRFGKQCANPNDPNAISEVIDLPQERQRVRIELIRWIQAREGLAD
jgi:hypothetical protein